MAGTSGKAGFGIRDWRFVKAGVAALRWISDPRNFLNLDSAVELWEIRIPNLESRIPAHIKNT